MSSALEFREEANLFPLMDEEGLRRLAASIDDQGQQSPISLYKGAILDGRNRWLAITKYCKNGRKPETVTVNPASPIAYVVAHNLERRHLNESQRALIGARMLPFYEAEAKTRQLQGRKPSGQLTGRSGEAREHAAREVNVGPCTVSRAKTVLAKGSAKLIEAVDTAALSIHKAAHIVRISTTEHEQNQRVAVVARSMLVTRVKGLTGEIEWYTPREYLDLAVQVMGGIDLDPASSVAAQKHVKARRYFSMENDGLTQDWSGRVWLNPPYAMPYIKQFVGKLVHSYLARDVVQAVLLVNNATDTEWFHSAVEACSAICFTRGRISFLDGEMLEKTAPTHGQAFFYFGKSVRKFEQVFSKIGCVLFCKRSKT